MKKLLLVFSIILLSISCNNSNDTQNKIIIDKQGSFTFGGKVSSADGEFEKDTLFPSSNGQTYHSDHGYAFYQIPVNAKKYFCMEEDNLLKALKLLQTAEKVFKIFS